MSLIVFVYMYDHVRVSVVCMSTACINVQEYVEYASVILHEL